MSAKNTRHSKAKKAKEEVKEEMKEESVEPHEPGPECYCLGGRRLGSLELWCAQCGRWFHGRCLRQLKDFAALNFMVCYTFACEDCSPTKEETWTAKQANFSHMCITALANIAWNERNSKEKSFSVNKKIIPYIDENWHWLTSMPRRIRNTWHQTVTRTMLKDPEVFIPEEGDADDDGDVKFRLWEADLALIGPDNDVIKGLGRRGPSAATAAAEESKEEASPATPSTPSLPPIEGPKTRGAKRKVADQGPLTKKNKGSDSTLTKYAGMGTLIDHPFNRDGYRYYLAEQDPHAPNRSEFESREDMAGKQIPSYFVRVMLAEGVCLSGHDRAPQLRMGEDWLSVTGEKGYSVVRATHGVAHGSWYFEVAFKEQPEGAHVRIGWTTELGNLQAPVGYDQFGYSWRSRKGTRFHDSNGKHYADGGFGQGDVLGCLLQLPLPPAKAPLLPNSCKELPVIKFKSQLYFEDKDEPAAAIKAFEAHPGSKMSFFKNGVPQGVAYADIPRGTYFPALSLYRSPVLKANFGPRFKFKPQGAPAFRPMSERSGQLPVEQTLSDVLYFVEKEGLLSLDALL